MAGEMAEDKVEIQRRYLHVRDLHERAKEAVLRRRVEVYEALEIAAEYFQAAEELEAYERERRSKHMEELAKLGVEMELDE
jgi:hypothetical protein